MNQIVSSENIATGEIVAPSEVVDVFYRRSPLRTAREHIRVPAGLSIAEILTLCEIDGPRLHVSIGGHVIECANWSRVRVKPGVSLVIVAVPGKGALRAIAGLVVALFAAVLAPLLIPAALVGTSAGMIATGLIGAGISLGDGLWLNMLMAGKGEYESEH